MYAANAAADGTATGAGGQRIRVEVSTQHAARLLKLVSGSAQCCALLGIQASDKPGDAGAAALIHLGFCEIGGVITYVSNSTMHQAAVASARALQVQTYAETLRAETERLRQALAQQTQACAQAQRLLEEERERQAARERQLKAEALAAQRSKGTAQASNNVLADKYYRTLSSETTKRFVKARRAACPHGTRRAQPARRSCRRECTLTLGLSPRVVVRPWAQPQVAVANTSPCPLLVTFWYLYRFVCTAALRHGTTIHKAGKLRTSGNSLSLHHRPRPDLYLISWSQRIQSLAPGNHHLNGVSHMMWHHHVVTM